MIIYNKHISLKGEGKTVAKAAQHEGYNLYVSGFFSLKLRKEDFIYGNRNRIGRVVFICFFISNLAWHICPT